MKKERTLSIITTGYFLLYSIFLILVEGILIYGIYLFQNGTTATANMLPAVDEIITAIIGFFTVFSTFSWLVSLILAMAVVIPLAICIAIFIHSCICLRKNPLLEKKRLKRDALVKTIFYICMLVFLISQRYQLNDLDIGGAFLIFVMFIIPFLISVVTLICCIKKNELV